MRAQTPGPYSVLNGKLFRDGATARTEVSMTEARDALNARADLLVALRLFEAWAAKQERDDLHPEQNGRTLLAKASAAIAKAMVTL